MITVFFYYPKALVLLAEGIFINFYFKNNCFKNKIVSKFCFNIQFVLSPLSIIKSAVHEFQIYKNLYFNITNYITGSVKDVKAPLRW